ncbi:MAG TPA: hypothetical protein VF243_03775 [Nitrosospira sp.]
MRDLIGVLVVSCIFYDLSQGPAFRLVLKGILPHRVFKGAYAPLFYVEKKIDPLERFNIWYMEFWFDESMGKYPGGKWESLDR